MRTGDYIIIEGKRIIFPDYTDITGDTQDYDEYDDVPSGTVVNFN